MNSPKPSRVGVAPENSFKGFRGKAHWLWQIKALVSGICRSSSIKIFKEAVEKVCSRFVRFRYRRKSRLAWRRLWRWSWGTCIRCTRHQFPLVWTSLGDRWCYLGTHKTRVTSHGHDDDFKHCNSTWLTIVSVGVPLTRSVPMSIKRSLSKVILANETTAIERSGRYLNTVQIHHIPTTPPLVLNILVILISLSCHQYACENIPLYLSGDPYMRGDSRACHCCRRWDRAIAEGMWTYFGKI